MSGDWNSYRCAEARTGLGQVLRITCKTDSGEEVEKFFREQIRTVTVPKNHAVNVSHGGYGAYSRFDIRQHKYAGGHGGYIEVLEIRDGPDGRHGIVLHNFDTAEGHHFSEWETLEDAKTAYEQTWSSREPKKEIKKRKGFKRLVKTGWLTPWFYAIGDEALIGDTAFPDGFQDDPVFKTGRRFVVYVRSQDMQMFLPSNAKQVYIPVIKTCMGCRIVREPVRGWDRYTDTAKHKERRMVVWSDGTIWTDGEDFPPVEVREGQTWIAEAQTQFGLMLAGHNTDFEIKFADGSKFVGKLVRPNGKQSSPAGDYFAAVQMEGEEKIREGWIYDFEPTEETPNIVERINNLAAQNGLRVKTAAIKSKRRNRSSRRWEGVYHEPARL